MYQNPFTPGYEVLSKSGYSMDSVSISNTASYLITNDFPDYAGMFYSLTEHEVISSIKYGNFEQGYDNLNEIRESLNGPPIEFYIPSSFVVSDGVGKQSEIQTFDKTENKLINIANKEIMKEIIKAQKEVKRKVKRIEFEDILMVRKRKMSVVFEDKE